MQGDGQDKNPGRIPLPTYAVDSVVKVTGFTNEEWRFNFWCRKEIYVPPSALGSNGPPIHGTGTRSPEVKQPGHTADFSPPLPPYDFLSRCVIRHRSDFTFVTDSTK